MGGSNDLYFYAVRDPNGSAASGYAFKAGGQPCPAVSGNGRIGSWCTPEGDYEHGGLEPLNEDDPKQIKGMSKAGDDWHKYKKSHIRKAGTGVDDAIKDEIRPDPYNLERWIGQGRPRTGLCWHFDGGEVGSGGCIAYQETWFQDVVGSNHGLDHVRYFEDEASMRAAIEYDIGHKVDWDKVTAPKHPATGYGPDGDGCGNRSRSKKGNKATRGERSVLVGPKKRELLHIGALLADGSRVSEGSSTVYVGEARAPMAGVEDMTTDGSPIDDGEVSVLFA